MSWLDGMRHRIHTWLHRREYEREVAEERRFHREMEAMERRGEEGRPRGEVHRGGGSGRRKVAPDGSSDPEGARPGSSLTDRFAQDARYALRGLARSPGFTAVVVLTLALGVGANAAAFSVLDRLFNRVPAGVTDPERLRRLYIEGTGLVSGDGEPGAFPAFTFSGYSAIAEAGDGVYDAAAWGPSTESTLQDGALGVSVRRSSVSFNYFSVLGVGAEQGRLFGEDEGRVDVPSHVAVISYGLWQRAFGLDPSIIGRSITLDDPYVIGRSAPALDAEELTVVGVVAEPFTGVELGQVDVFVLLGPTSAPPQGGRPWYEGTSSQLYVAARIAPGVSDSQMSERATAAYLGRSPPENLGGAMGSYAISTGSIIETRGPGRRAASRTQAPGLSISTRAAGITTILLLITCVNLAALLLVRANRRRRETAVRLAMGCSRGRLACHIMSEALLLTALAGALAVAVAVFGGRVLRGLLFPDVAWSRAVLEPRIVAFSLATAGLVTTLASLAPVVRSWRIDVSPSLKSGGTSGGSPCGSPRSTLRSTLIAVQAALSIVLLFGAGLFIASLGNARAMRLGYDVDQVAYVGGLRSGPGSPDHDAAVADVASQLAEAPGVSMVALAAREPSTVAGVRRLFLHDETSPDRMHRAYYNVVSPAFFDVTGMRIVEGRAFEPGETDAVVVDERMARTYWPDRSALGECVIVDRPDPACREVVGVVEDQRARVTSDLSSVQFFLPLQAGIGGSPSASPQYVLLRIDPRRWSQVAAAARRAVASRFNERKVGIHRMSDVLEPQFRSWRLGAELFAAAGMLALLLTSIGVYGVTAYSVSERRHEMGVRVALGARLRDIATLVLRDGLRVVAAGIALGIGACLVLGRLVQALLFGVTPRDPASAFAAAAALLVAAVAACLLPVLRAGLATPHEVLREE